MVKIRVFPFISKHLRGEAERGEDVKDVETFKSWVMKYGEAFSHDQGAGEYGDVIIFAWKERAGEWRPVGDAIVKFSRKTHDRKWVEVTTGAVRIYPSNVPPLKVKKRGQKIIPLTSREYGELIAQAYK